MSGSNLCNDGTTLAASTSYASTISIIMFIFILLF